MSTQSTHLSSTCPSLDFTWPPFPYSGLYFNAVVVQLDSESSPQQPVEIPEHNTLDQDSTEKKDTMMQFSPFPKVSWIATDWSMVWRRQLLCVTISAPSLSRAPPAPKCPQDFQEFRLFPFRVKVERTSGGETPLQPRALTRHYSLSRSRCVASKTRGCHALLQIVRWTHSDVTCRRSPPPRDRSTPRVTNPKGLFSKNRVWIS